MSDSQRASGTRRIWSARVVADAPRRPKSEAPSVPEHISELARQAAFSAEESARQAARAARAASLAEVAVDRIAADVHQARSTTLDIAGAAAVAADAAATAHARADLTQIAAEFDRPRPETREIREHRSPTDSASHRD